MNRPLLFVDSGRCGIAHTTPRTDVTGLPPAALAELLETLSTVREPD